MVTALVPPDCGLDKRQLMNGLARAGIDTRPFFHPLSSLPAYAHLPQTRDAAMRNPNAYRLSPRGINLPSGLQLTRPDVDRVCAAFEHMLASAPSHPAP
jgi:perosamine synthetase